MDTEESTRGQGAVAQAYPARQLIAAAQGWRGCTVAIRGMGLSAIDVLRGLTVAQGGAFFDGQYLPSGREPARILPFSLDGLPPFPKPETGALDRRFAPRLAETRIFDDAMAEAAQSAPYTARRLINAALIAPVTRILRDADDDDGAAQKHEKRQPQERHEEEQRAPAHARNRLSVLPPPRRLPLRPAVAEEERAVR